MMNFDDVIKDKIKKHNPYWSETPDYPYRIVIVVDSGSRKTNSLFNLISQQPDVDKMYLYAKDPYETKYQFLNNKGESTGWNIFLILKPLLKTRIIWMKFMNTLKNTTANKKNIKYCF